MLLHSPGGIRCNEARSEIYCDQQACLFNRKSIQSLDEIEKKRYRQTSEAEQFNRRISDVRGMYCAVPLDSVKSWIRLTLYHKDITCITCIQSNNKVSK